MFFQRPSPTLIPVFALLIAATAWGSVWYPYRLLNEVGIGGGLASILTYGLSLPFLGWLYGAQSQAYRRFWKGLLLLALATGWTNLSYVLAVLNGEILRVMLLFYLAPVWTLLFSWALLGEVPDRRGYAVFVLALAGAWVMLDVGHGWPLPTNGGEWLGLASGMGFALANVLTRQLAPVPVGVRSLWIFVGVLVVSLPALAYEATLPGAGAWLAVLTGWDAWLWILLIAVVLFFATHAVQYGLAHIPPNRGIIILLFELIVVAVTGVWWANEIIEINEWIGGAMILAATLVTAKGKDHGPAH